MAEPVRIKSSLLKLLKKATQQSVDNISTTDSSSDSDIDQAALVAILVLLRYHPQKEVGKFYIDKVNRILQWKEEDTSRYSLMRKPKLGSAKSEIVDGGNLDPGRDPYVKFWILLLPMVSCFRSGRKNKKRLGMSFKRCRILPTVQLKNNTDLIRLYRRPYLFQRPEGELTQPVVRT